MPYNQADLDALDAAIAKGVKRVEYADRSITYRSVEEMQQARTLVARQLASTPRPKQTVLYGETGL